MSTATLTELEREQRARAVLFRPDTFAFACTRNRRPDARFMLPPHIRYLAGEIVNAIIGGYYLTIEATVRHGKSSLASEWTPPWYLGCWPDRRVGLASYEADFAASWGGKARDILEEFGHLYGVRVDPASSSRDRWDILGTPGGMITAGVGGAITGRGFDLLLIDDPFKNADEAMSQTIRDKRWDWLQSTALTRIEPGGIAIVTMARWHEDDFIGRLHNPEFTPPGRWKRIRLPALAEENDPLGREPGEALWPERYDREALERIRSERGTYWFGALYQQAPTPLGGGIFQRKHFRTWRESDDGKTYLLRRGGDGDDQPVELVEKRSCVRFQLWDLAVSTRTTADFTVCTTWDMTPGRDLILRDVLRLRVEGAEHLSLLHSQYAAHLPAWVGIERVAYQLALVQSARKAGLPVRELVPDKDKVSRALTAAARYEGHAVFHPAATVAPWLGEWESELLAFPNGSHDDQVDNASYAADVVTTTTLSNAWRALLEDQAGSAQPAPVVVDGVPLVAAVPVSNALKPWQMDGFYDD